MARWTLTEARERVARALQSAGASDAMAASTAGALVLAESQGLSSHGLTRVAQYASHLRNGRADGQAVPRLLREHGACATVDAGCGLAFPACAYAVEQAQARARTSGVGIVGVVNSHHAGVIVDHLRPLAAAGLVGLGFSNSPSAMPAARGKHPIFGTNPIAAVFPRRAGAPLLIDLSLSEVARGKLMVAAREGRPIPLGWALDADGNPTTDAKAGLHGSMLPIGAATSDKGAVLTLLVELLVTVLIGGAFGYEASSFFVDEGNRPRLGQLFVAIDPGALAGSDAYLDRLEVLIVEMLRDDGVRLPGQRREELRARAEREGVEVPDTLAAQITALA